MTKKHAKIIILIIVLIEAGAFVWMYSAANKGPDMPMVVSSGEADIGGPFDLVDTLGQTVTDQDLHGRFVLVYFGYTNCPDVCPVDMNRISLALDALGRGMDFSDKLQPVFITIDPARDNAEAIALFLEQYHPAFLGLTGTPDQIDKAAKAYKVAYGHMLAREHDPEGMVRHTSYIYLMDRQGNFVTMYDTAITAPALADDLAKRLD